MPEERPQREYLKHQVPPWLALDTSNSAFFITICCQERGRNHLASDAVWEDLLDSILNRNEREIWFCTLFLAMPDHVHGIFRFEEDTGMTKAMADWKRWTAKTLGVEWQRGFFDHRLRSRESGEGKKNYILQNPVRAGLVEKSSDWRYVFDGL